MRTVEKWIDKFCQDHPNFGISNLMLYIAIANVTVSFVDNFSSYSLSSALFFLRSRIFQGRSGG